MRDKYQRMTLTKGICSRWVKLLILMFASATNAVQASFSNPVVGIVAENNATISFPSSSVLQINQTSDKAIINWQSYNVAQHEQVNYQQPNASSITLNRINPNNGSSRIFGTITANGRVWLTNGAGIWFGPTAHVRGLIATTVNILDQDFMSGNYHFVNLLIGIVQLSMKEPSLYEMQDLLF